MLPAHQKATSELNLGKKSSDGLSTTFRPKMPRSIAIFLIQHQKTAKTAKSTYIVGSQSKPNLPQSSKLTFNTAQQSIVIHLKSMIPTINLYFPYNPPTHPNKVPTAFWMPSRQREQEEKKLNFTWHLWVSYALTVWLALSGPPPPSNLPISHKLCSFVAFRKCSDGSFARNDLQSIRNGVTLFNESFDPV